MKFFRPNIGKAGRWLRALFGVAMIIAGVALHHHSWWLCVALAAIGAFGLVEAARGWCLARACGLKTRF